MQAKLSPAEANTLTAAPTKDTAAYDLFLKGEYEERLAENSLRPESYEQAAAWYQQAIARDPNFALAMARLVRNRMDRHWFLEQMTDAELAEVHSMAEHAIALAPTLAEAHVALGNYFYHGYRQYEQALTEFERALQLQPNAATAVEYSGYVHRRQGQWARCLDEFKRALEEDPRNALLAGNVAATYVTLRMWKETEKARQLLEERLRERPNEISSITQLSWVYLALKRDRESINLARKAADLLPPEKDALDGNILQAGLAELEARTGAASDAIAILRRLLTIPAGETVSIAHLQIDPVLDLIRNDPGFQQLLAGKEHVGP